MNSRKTGAFISECRKAKGMTQQELADALGVTNKAVSKWETGGGMPDISLLIPLCEVLGVTVEELMDGKKSEQKVTKKSRIADLKRKKYSLTKKQVLSILCLVLSALGVLMQILYEAVGKRYRLEYMAGWMWYAVNGICLILVIIAVWNLLAEKNKIRYRMTLILLLLCVVNLGAGFLKNENIRDVISISPGFHNIAVMRQNLENGSVVTYRPGILWFVRESNPLPYTADEKLKIQWLEQDVCAITYTSPDDNEVHQYVMTYGVRGNGITSPPVYQVLDGAWVQKDETTVSWALETDVDGVHLRKGNKEYLYGYDDCVQFGTLAMALCHNGLPQWTVSLNKDCIMNNENQGHDFITEGTISLCKVSMAKTAPIILEGGIPEETYEIKPSPTGEEQGKLLVDEMKRMVNSLGEMETLEDSASYLKIVTDSTNPFDIGRMAAEQEDKVRSVNGIDVGVQITSMQLLAGDIYDFLLEVNVTENFSNPENSEEESEADLSRKYRIMKCDDGYLAAPVAIRVDGTYGLEAPAMEQKLETANDSAYYYFVAGQR